MFRNIYTGGACTAGDGQQMSSNPFRQFMDKMIFGQTEQGLMQQQLNVQQDQSINTQIQQRQQQFQQMNQHWGQLAEQFDQASLEDRKQMERIYQDEQLRFAEMQQFQQHQMAMQWQEANYQHEADQLAQEFKFNDAFDNAEQQVNLEAQNKQAQQYAGDMMQVIMNDPDPKFQQSKFLGFLQQLNSGQIKIKDKGLIDNEGKTIEQAALERADLETVWKQAEKQAGDMPDYEKMWNQKVEDYEESLKDDVTFEKRLEMEYQKILETMDKQGNYDDLMSDAWQKASDLQEFELYKDASDKYSFTQNNPYLTSEFPLQISLTLVNKGQNTEAILALEAHLQKHNEDSNAWRILGRLHQENDQDQRAVAAFLNSMKFDANNLDTLSALGISCTNILDEVKAMNFLKQWLIKNPQYGMMGIDMNVVPDNTTIDDYTMDQIKNMNVNMIGIFEQAFQLNSNDVELMNGLAVLYFIQRNYQQSVEFFKKALQIEPKNYQIWNKLGATLAHLGEAEQAMFCYHRALDLRPNYVRVWVNLAFAYSYKGEYVEAVRLYLSALTINPQAKHIWGYLQTAFMQLQRPDLVGKIQFYDPSLFVNDFKITTPNDLPEPEILYRQANNQYIFKMPEEEWIKQFEGK